MATDADFTRRVERLDVTQLRTLLGEVREMAGTAHSDEEGRLIASRIAQVTRQYRLQTGVGIAGSPLAQARELNSHYRERPHLAYLSSRIVQAVRDVERGQNRHLLVSMPPRSGKSTMTSKYAPLWMLRRHPEWSIVMTSHDDMLVAEWAGDIRNYIEDRPDLGIALTRDAGARGRWSTVEDGGMYAVSVGGKLTGRGARVMIIDDPISDFAAAHSPRVRENLWNWWLSVARTRLEAPYLVLVTMTRWHEDDFAGRLLSPEYEGDPREWENVRLPAIAEGSDDILRRPEGAPLLSPLQDENVPRALERWESTKVSVGTYTFASMYQQRPAPQKGAIFDVGWWRYWTTDPMRATDDGRVVYLDPETLTGGAWLDSWDCAFKGGDAASSWVVGQRWVRQGANRYLIAQQRGRWSFTETIKAMEVWAREDDAFASPCGHLVHKRLVEEKANGAAIIDTLRDRISGLKPINPGNSKEARAYAITPEVESGNVYLPHPADPGNEWVPDLLSELRNFPHDAHDDQVDSLTQALSDLRGNVRGGVTVPGRLQAQGRAAQGVPRSIGQAALTDVRRRAVRN